MARYRGPVCKLCRREGAKLFLKGERCLSPKCAMEPNKRPYPPGARQSRRRKATDFGLQLREKQKVKRIYGVLESQFRRYYKIAEQKPGATGENLLQYLEMRFDNVVYRLGFAESRSQARQLILHGHFQINNRKNNVPSTLLVPGDVVSVKEKSKDKEFFKVMLDSLGSKSIPSWLSLDIINTTGRVLSAPARADIDPTISEQLIVEFYSR